MRSDARSEPANKHTFVNVQALRGIAALAVVLFHLAMRDLQDWPQPHFRVLECFYYCGMGGVDLFFVISGFVIASSSFKYFGKWDGIFDFALKRFYRVYPLYWITSLPLLALSIVHGGKDWFGSIAALCLVPSFIREVNPVAWSLVHEVMFYFVFAFFMLFEKRFTMLFLLAWASVITFSFSHPGAIFPNFVYGATFLSLYNFSFMFGVAIAFLANSKLLIAPRLSVFAGLFLLGAGAVLSMLNLVDSLQGFPNRLIFLGFSSALIVYGLLGLELHEKRVLPQGLKLLGDASYSLYLVHYVVILFAKPLYPSITDGFQMVSWTIFLLVFSIMSSLICYFCIEKPLIGLFRDKMLDRRRRLVEKPSVQMEEKKALVGSASGRGN